MDKKMDKMDGRNFNSDTWEGIRRVGPPNRIEPVFVTPPKLQRQQSDAMYLDRAPAEKRKRGVTLATEDEIDEDFEMQMVAAADEEERNYINFLARKADKVEVYRVFMTNHVIKIWEDANSELTHSIEKLDVIDLTK